MTMQLIEAFKKRLEQHNGEIDVQQMDGSGEIVKMSSRFHPPATKEMIDELKNHFSSELPPDYVAFLESCNGAVLYIHPQYGSENLLFSVGEILGRSWVNDYPDKMEVAYILDDRIVIDLEKWRNGDEHYLYLCESLSPLDDVRSLYCNFETWLERFIISQGNKYWYWRVGKSPYS